MYDIAEARRIELEATAWRSRAEVNEEIQPRRLIADERGFLALACGVGRALLGIKILHEFRRHIGRLRRYTKAEDGNARHYSTALKSFSRNGLPSIERPARSPARASR